MQPGWQHEKEMIHEQTEGQLKPFLTSNPSRWATQNWHRRGTWDLEREMLSASLQARSEQVLPAISSNNPGAKGCRAEFEQPFPRNSCKAGLSLLHKQLLGCFALQHSACGQVGMASAEKPSQP